MKIPLKRKEISAVRAVYQSGTQWHDEPCTYLRMDAIYALELLTTKSYYHSMAVFRLFFLEKSSGWIVNWLEIRYFIALLGPFIGAL